MCFQVTSDVWVDLKIKIKIEIKIAKNPKYYKYLRDLASMVYKFCDISLHVVTSTLCSTRCSATRLQNSLLLLTQEKELILV